MSVRVRFAPSPTGFLHVGGARTALFNFLLAQKYQGKFILRIEDTDQDRNQDRFLKEQLEALAWLGLHWDEGPLKTDIQNQKGEFGPYRQSQRKKTYQQYAQKLLKENKAYYCFLTDEEISQMKEKALQKGQTFRIESPYKNWSLNQGLEKKNQGHPCVVRFKISEAQKEYTFEDGVRGVIQFPSDMVGDFVLLRSNGMPVYNFCCAVDDALMQITHVLRAEEHLANTLRQMMILEALGFKKPQYFHVSLILDSEKKKLSKRSGSVSTLEYKKEGYLPHALNNFLALLGWNAGDEREVMSQEELIEKFCEKNLNSSGAIFDVQKLKWINEQHLKKMPDDELWKAFDSFLEKEKLPQSQEWVKQALSLLKPSFSTLKEGGQLFSLFYKDGFNIEPSSQEIKKWDSTRSVLEKWKEELEKREFEYLTEEEFKEIQKEIQKIAQGRFLFMPLRVAIIGRLHGFEMSKAVCLLDRRTLLQRVQETLLFMQEK